MTAPVTHGFPDWGRFQAQSTVVYVRLSAAATVGTDSYGPFFVGDVQSLGFAFFSGNNAGQAFVTWCADAAGTQTLAQEQYHVTALGQINIGIPVAGPWVTIDVVVGAAGALTYDLLAWSMPNRRTIPDAPADNLLISSSNVAIAGAATATLNATRTWPGAAYWSSWQGLANFVVFLEAVDANGTVYVLERWQGAGVDFNRMVYLPNLPVRIRHTNQAGATQRSDFLVAAHSIMSN